MPGAGLGQNVFFAKTLSFRLSFCYRFGLRFSYFLCMLKLRCSVTRKGRQGGQAASGQLGFLSLAAWMCNSCSLAAGLLGSLVARQLSRLTAWQLCIYKCIYICSMMYKFIILCGRYRFFFLIVLPWFGHVFSNKGRFGHKRKVPGFFYNLKW